MSTTNLFVELLVIGVAAAIWVLLLVLASFGYSWVPVERILSPAALIPLLSLTYVLGIVTDRLADSLFELLWGRHIRASVYDDDTTYFHDRRSILARGSPSAELAEYARSRVRICRGWAFNLVFVIVAFDVFSLWRLSNHLLTTLLTLALALLCGACWFAWRTMKHIEYVKTKEEAAFLSEVARNL